MLFHLNSQKEPKELIVDGFLTVQADKTYSTTDFPGLQDASIFKELIRMRFLLSGNIPKKSMSQTIKKTYSTAKKKRKTSASAEQNTPIATFKKDESIADVLGLESSGDNNTYVNVH